MKTPILLKEYGIIRVAKSFLLLQKRLFENSNFFAFAAFLRPNGRGGGSTISRAS